MQTSQPLTPAVASAPPASRTFCSSRGTHAFELKRGRLVSFERRKEQRIEHRGSGGTPGLTWDNIVLRDAAGIDYPFALRNFFLEVAADDELTVVWARQTERRADDLGPNNYPLAVRRESTGVIFYSPGLPGFFFSLPDVVRMALRIALYGALLGAVAMTMLGSGVASTIWVLGVFVAPLAYVGISAARIPGRVAALKAQLFR
jgi:hypothetical protein